jgi:hypothetical protein
MHGGPAFHEGGVSSVTARHITALAAIMIPQAAEISHTTVRNPQSLVTIYAGVRYRGAFLYC